MIHGVGTDLVSVKRIEETLFKFGDRFLHRILSETEVAEYAESSQPAKFLAKRFAAKSRSTFHPIKTGRKWIC